jgi:hypothetical protein
MNVFRLISVLLLVLAVNLPLYAQEAQTEEDYNNWLSSQFPSIVPGEYDRITTVEESTITDMDYSKPGRIGTLTKIATTTERVNVIGDGAPSYETNVAKLSVSNKTRAC